MQQNDSGERAPCDATPDEQDRIDDFLARHGGPGPAPRRAEVLAAGERGWYELCAADGHLLRCDWSRVGGRNEFKFSELAPSPAPPGGGSRAQ